MAGLYAPLGGGGTVGSVAPAGYTSGAAVVPGGVQSPAVMAYGPTVTGVPVSGTSSGQVAVYIGIAALAGLLLIRHSLPK
jgi:hypothetical protein